MGQKYAKLLPQLMLHKFKMKSLQCVKFLVLLSLVLPLVCTHSFVLALVVNYVCLTPRRATNGGRKMHFSVRKRHNYSSSYIEP